MNTILTRGKTNKEITTGMNYRNSNTAVCRGCAQSDTFGEKRSFTAQPEQALPANVPVMVYITGQEWDCVYPAERALLQGTLFPALDKPFFGKGGCCGE